MQNVITNVLNKMWLFPLLALITLLLGQICNVSCVFLRGEILGLDLEILGIVFYSLILFSVVFYSKYYPESWLIKTIVGIVSIGIGVELILIEFQVRNGMYCPKCLISGVFLFMMFFTGVRHLKKWFVIVLIGLGALFASVTFHGSITPSYAQNIPSMSFGNEKSQTEIIIYSDYFCPACRKIDDQINAVISKKNKKIKIYFIDVPLHESSLEYAEVFLYACFADGKDLGRAIKVREILFNAAERKTDQRTVLHILNSQKIPFKEDKENARGIFRSLYNPLIQKDKINATPAVVIMKGNKRTSYVGGSKIMKALKELSVL